MMSVCFHLSFTDEDRRFFHVPVRKKVMLLGIYSQIKEQVSTREVAEYYGYKVSRKGTMRCPFHEDKTPSMKVDKNFVCFGCQEKGDMIRFASKLFGLPPYDAAGKLIEDMGLTVTAENRPEVQPGIRQKAKRERTEKQQFEQAVKRIYNVFCDYLHLLNHWAEEYAPRSPTEDFHPLFVEAMHKMDYVGYLLDLLLYGSREDKAFVVIEKGKEVDDLERRIREAKSGDGERAPGGDSGLTAGDDDGGREGSSGNDGERSGEKLHHKRRNDPVL